MTSLEPIFVLLIGLALVLAGRKMFWIFIAVAGFLAGLSFGMNYFGDPMSAQAIGVGIVCAVASCLIALLIPPLAAATAGFLAAGCVGSEILAALAGPGSPWQTAAFITAGIVGAALALAAFDWVLAIFSSLLGATMILTVLTVPPAWHVPALVAIAALGCVIQLWGFRDDPDSVAGTGHRPV
jgi:hypothetical protein